MNDAERHFLTLLGRPPLRLTVEQVALVVNCKPHDVPALVTARLLKPLGDPQPNSVKFFATAEVLELAQDRPKLAKLTQVIYQHWQRKNARKKTEAAGEAPPEASPVLLLAGE